MRHVKIVREIAANLPVFKALLERWPQETRLWKPRPEKWCALEIVCHLVDEEREDFRARTKSVLENPNQPFTSIDPVNWVSQRNYIQQDFGEKLNEFLEERRQSIQWLQSLKNPKWDNAFEHPKLGPLTASRFLANWLAHDYMHLRQLLRLKFDYLQEISGEDLSYAGNW